VFDKVNMIYKYILIDIKNNRIKIDLILNHCLLINFQG